MDLTRVIVGPIVTEKAERLKAGMQTYTLRVAPQATKIDVRKALKMYYDAEVRSIRMIRVRSKVRAISANATMEKRKPFKKALVTLQKDAKALDLAQFRTIDS